MRYNSLKSGCHRLGLRLRRRVPSILVAVGIGGMVVSAIMACVATTRIGEVTEEIAAVHTGAATEQNAKERPTAVYRRATICFAKLYGPSISLGVLSALCILASHHLLTRRGVALAAAYATVDKSFRDYRRRVVERYGEDVDRSLRYGLPSEDTEGPIACDGFMCRFDASSVYWEDDDAENLRFIRERQRVANNMLRSKGYLFLNDVYQMLGVKKTAAGQSVGWLYDGAFHGNSTVVITVLEAGGEIQNGAVRPGHTMLLDFNVEGDIVHDFVYYDKM